VSLKDELESDVTDIFRSQWTTRDGRTVPDTDDIALGNDGVTLDGTVLYADLAESTALVDGNTPSFAAEVYKAYLLCASKVIRSEGGEITAFDGDRVMAVFVGDFKNTSAARCALKINWAVKELVNPAIAKQYPNNSYRVSHAVGIDRSSLFVARTGIRGSNDLVWVGRAANYAAKLSALRTGHASYITKDVFDAMKDEVKVHDSKGIWEERQWTWNNMTIYRSNWTWLI
jgi:class 3 adenylate cyclase